MLKHVFVDVSTVYRGVTMVGTRAPQQKSEENLEDLLSHVLEEARMVLPGIQALLGFQLVAVFNQSFAHMLFRDQLVHLIAIILSVNAICFLLTPAALHRQCTPNKVTYAFVRRSSTLIFIGMMPLLLSIVLDSYIVSNIVTKNVNQSVLIAGVLFLELAYCWVIWPQMKRLSHSKATPEC